MIPILDILQCVPVLGFMPSLVLGLVAVFPNSNIGVELACIIMIFTSQAWNMCFSFYASVKSVPTDLVDVTRVIGLSWWQRVRTIELPFSAIGLAWNSLMSMAGGWFFLTVCESFALGNKKYQLPGIGSYMATAIDRGDHRAMLYGIVAMSIVIVIVDFVIWRPVMTWVRKFQMEEIPDDVADLPFVTTLLAESRLLRRLKLLSRRRSIRKVKVAPSEPAPAELKALPLFRERLLKIKNSITRHKLWNFDVLAGLAAPLAIFMCVFVGIRIWELVRTLSAHDWKVIWWGVWLTFVRVTVATILSSIWAIPAAICIGLSPRLTQIFQPIIQVVASFPAPMIYPLVITGMLRLGIGMHWGASLLMLLGVQWYVLFNVLAGAMSITRDLKDGLTMMGVRPAARWWRLYLPAAFPALVTGWITAAGGAWNASIVAEYIVYSGKTLIAPGIGSMISQATAAADYPRLAGCLLAMVVTVVGINQTFWRWLAETAETKFRFER